MKWGVYAVMILCTLLAWGSYSKQGRDLEEQAKVISQLKNGGEATEKEISDAEGNKANIENTRTFSGILLVLLTAGLIGIVFVIHVLPAMAHRVTHAVYDSAEEVEKDPMHDGRAKVAQGDWEGAIEAFRMAAAAQPLNRLPWVEIAKIQLDHLEDVPAAVQTMRTAIEGQEWEENDAAFLMFRLAEIYETKVGDHGSAATIMNQVIEQFPETRHSANARHKLREWGLA